MNDEAGSASIDVTPPRAMLPLGLRLVGETAAMVRFYSRLPLPALGRFDDPADPPPFADACRMLPLASLALALAPALAAVLLGMTALPALFIAAIVTTASLAISGALHEDGLADMIDGFGGGGDVSRKLAIMKDSRIGSYGAAALVLALISRVALIAALLGLSPVTAAMSLIAAAVLSRALSLGLFAALPAARADGVASTVGRPGGGAIAIAGALTIGLTLLLAAPWLGVVRVCLGFTVALLVTLVLGRLAVKQIGGQTGDVLGAAQVLAEIAFLGGALMI